MKLSELAKQITDYIAENGDVEDVVVWDNREDYITPRFHMDTRVGYKTVKHIIELI